MSKRKKQVVSRKQELKNNYSGKLSLVIPCYNESKRLSDLFSKLEQFKKEWQGPLEIIFVNDGSSDDTLNKLEQATSQLSSGDVGVEAKTVNLEKNSGKGAALKAGVAEATGNHILTVDADMSTVPGELNEWLKNLPGNDFPEGEILIASREHQDSRIEARPIRRFAGLIFNFIIQLFTNLNIKDTQCGFKLYPAAIARDLFGKLSTIGWAHDVELLYRAKLANINVSEMPISWNHQEGSKISLVKDSIRMFIQVMQISWKLNLEYFVLEPLRSAKLSGNQTESPVFRLLFVVTAVLLLVVMPLLSFDYGITGDEYVQKEYGDKVLAYFETNGTDQEALNYKNLYYYGGLFDYSASWLNEHVGGLDVYAMRHLLNSLTGFLLFLFAGLLGKELSGSWRIAFFSLLFVALSPRLFGHAMNNPKDIPFAAAYTFTLLYLVRFLKELPRPAIKTLVFLIIGIAAAINVRVGGILLIAYFGLFSGLIYLWRIELRLQLKKVSGWMNIAGLVLLVSVLGYFGGLLFWPWALQDPLSNPLKSLSEMSNFSVSIKMLFEGRHLWSDQLPWYYIPKWIAIGSPLFLLAGVLLFPVFLLKHYRSGSFIYLLFVAFTAVFPVSYAVLKGSSLYDGMRHFLFVIPILAVLSAWSWGNLIDWKPAAAYRYSVSGALTFGLLLPLFWMFGNHPYQTVYFNEVFGKAKNAYGNYEMDYWMNSMKTMCEWLVENDPEIRSGAEKTILTSSSHPVAYYMSQLAPNVKVDYVRYTDRHAKAGDYFIFFNRFVDRGLLLSGAWPPGELVHQETVDGIPIAAITKTEPNGFAVRGKAAADSGDLESALTLYQQAVAADPKDELSWQVLAQIYLNANQFAQAKAALDHLLTLSDSDFSTAYLLAQYYYNQGQVDEALTAFETCKYLNYKENSVYYYLAAIQLNKGNMQAALQEVEAFDRTGGNIPQVYEMGVNAANQLNQPAKSRYFDSKKAFLSGNSQEAFRLVNEAIALDANYQPAINFRNMFRAN